jgi:UDP-N-acetylmuramate--alanine ligase
VTAGPLLPAEELGRVHFVGIGGAGMSGIARIMLARGLPVSGSDAKDSVTLAALRALGATVHVGHEAANLGDADTVVVSTAIRQTNPELLAADQRGLRVIHRASALASVMAGRRALAVAGTHGKTTTTSLLTVAIQHCGADPSFAIGGNLNESGANAHNGSGDVFVAEADESDGSFLLYSPHAAIVTNVEPDHLDHYGTPEAVAQAFEQFVTKVDTAAEGGFLVTCADDAGAGHLAGVARAAGIDVRTYGEGAGADLRLADIVTKGLGGSFEPVLGGRRLERVELRLPGRHNALNAAGALLAGLGLGFPLDRLVEGLTSFSGTRRRFEHKGTVGDVRVYDSYAHHPTELAADLAAARDVADGGRVVVVFQPHLFSRTQYFADDFGRALGQADEVVVMDVYAAREDPVPGVTGALVAAAVPLPPQQVVFEPSWSSVAGHLADRAKPGDVVITCGAGDVTMIGPEVLSRLAAGDQS